MKIVFKAQGERRFFRTCIRWLTTYYDTDAVRRNLKYIPTFGRWDDLYELIDTQLENKVFDMFKEQLAIDMNSNTPSLLAKWLKSENTSSKESRRLANRTRIALGMTHKQYRRTLAILRERINILERLISENRWDEIEFDKIPSKAGLKYRKAFMRHDIKNEYAQFMLNKDTKVNTGTLYPYEIIHEVNQMVYDNKVKIAALDKYWENLTDYFNGAALDAIAVVDTSGSMTCSINSQTTATPLDVAVSLGLYCADKAKGPLANHFITFSYKPEFVEVNGNNIVEKVRNMSKANWGFNTDIKAVMDLLRDTALKTGMNGADMPKSVIIISDMEFDRAVYDASISSTNSILFEGIANEWAAYGLTMPRLIFWNVNARHNNVPMRDDRYVTLVSGFSPIIFESVMSGKNGYDLMMDKLDSERYIDIY